jgi:hypothetical protein
MRGEPETGICFQREMSLKLAREKGMLLVNDDHYAELGKFELTEMQELLNGSRAIRFEASDRDIVYGFVERVLQNQRYSRLSKSPRGIVRQFLIKVTGLSRAQITRLIQGWSENRKVAAQPHYRPSFSRRYGALT